MKELQLRKIRGSCTGNVNSNPFLFFELLSIACNKWSPIAWTYTSQDESGQEREGGILSTHMRAEHKSTLTWWHGAALENRHWLLILTATYALYHCLIQEKWEEWVGREGWDSWQAHCKWGTWNLKANQQRGLHPGWQLNILFPLSLQGEHSFHNK